ncbi:MAG: YfcC family protein [Erysipelotrichaceae bacterium]|nr:YfcC family protein [Erysipelotrichaceae bacterium]
MQKTKQNISTVSFIRALIVIFTLMAFTYGLTFVIPSGEYVRSVDALGNLVIDPSLSFTFVDGHISFFNWLLSPLLVLFSEGSFSIIAVILFLLIIGGIFNCLDVCGLMRYMLDSITIKFQNKRYLLLAMITLFFMALGSLVGSFEECVPLVPIVVMIAIRFGWDKITGLGMSLLAVGCGFACGVCNPFTVGVAQQLANLPMFSGMGYRLFAFVIIYLVLLLFLYSHSKKVEQNIQNVSFSFKPEKHMQKALYAFTSILCIGILCVILSAFIPALQDITMIIVAITFLVAGLTATILAKMSNKDILHHFTSGVINMLPAILMILMANSIKYTLIEAQILDTLLYYAMQIANTLPKYTIILFIYLIVLIMNFFIPSGSAKAFLLIPLIVPVAQVFGISTQLCIMAFAFGDGFSKIFYPTNPVLLISLGVAELDYFSWIKWSWKFQLLNILITSGLLLLGMVIGY